MEKTNVCRVLDQKKIPYEQHEYDTNFTNAVDVANQLGKDPAATFKTLVTIGADRKNYVFVVPAAETLDLKKAAKVAGVKSIQMILQKELLPLTGYIHGGCSPIGMKKQFPTFIHETALNFDTIMFSAGKVGAQVEMAPKALIDLMRIRVADIIVKTEA